MKRRLVMILAAAALLLAACGAESAADGLAFPKLSYDPGPMPEAALEPVPDTPSEDGIAAEAEAVPASRIYALSVMDAGHTADDAAVIGDALIAGDADRRDYALVWARFTNDGGEISITERRVIMRGAEAADKSAEWLCGMTATPDGNFLVLTGEPPRAYRAVTGADSFADHENPDYAGRYRLTRFSAGGEVLDSMELTLPADAAGRIWAAEGGKLFIEGGIMDADRMPYQYFSGYYFSDRLILTLDAATGEVLHTLSTADYRVYPICSGSAGVYGERLYGHIAAAAPPDIAQSLSSIVSTLGFLDPAKDSAAAAEAIEWDGTPVLYPAYGNNAAALTAGGCRTQDGSIVMNTAFTFGRYDPETGEYSPFLSAQPENQSGYASPYGSTSFDFVSLCYLGGTAFIGAQRGADTLFVVAGV